MAQLTFFTGPMDCGKSTLALQLDHTHTLAGRSGRLFTAHDRSGDARITTRLGLSKPAIEVTEELNFWDTVIAELVAGRRVDYLVCDEAQFYGVDQINQLARIVDELQLDVFAVGILTDFRTTMFPGSQRLVELCDRMEVLQVHALCWCGARATHNARTVDGGMVTEGSQVVVGDTAEEDPQGRVVLPPGPEPVVAYEVLCRRHHRRRMTRAVAQATLNPDPLPFEDPDAIDPQTEEKP